MLKVNEHFGRFKRLCPFVDIMYFQSDTDLIMEVCYECLKTDKPCLENTCPRLGGGKSEPLNEASA